MSYDETQELTEDQIDRQDFVDGAIYEMICDVLEEMDVKPDWDMAIIGEIRDEIEEFYFKTDEEKYDFYPWIVREK